MATGEKENVKNSVNAASRHAQDRSGDFSTKRSTVATV